MWSSTGRRYPPFLQQLVLELLVLLGFGELSVEGEDNRSPNVSVRDCGGHKAHRGTIGMRILGVDRVT